MINPLDPWVGFSESMPARVTSRDSAKKLASQLVSMQTSRSGIKALGGKEEPKTKRGFLSALFDPVSSPLFAPARFVSAGAADILGLAQDTELSDYNPLESAIRAGKGDFAVTGGDIIRTEEGEGALPRVAKLGGALAIDVFADPLNYLGGVGVFTRKGILKASLGSSEQRLKLLSTLEVAGAAKLGAEQIDNVVNSLAAQTRDVVASKGKYVINESGQILDTVNKSIIDNNFRRSLAAKTLTNVVADGFNKGGRSGLIKSLAKTVGDEDVARTVFKSLDKELVGGLFIKTPVTGRPLYRIAGGEGAANPVTDVLNKIRFRLSAGFTGEKVSAEATGRFGPTWAAYKKNLLKTEPDQLAVGRTLFTDFADYKDFVQTELKDTYAKYVSRVRVVQQTVVRARKAFNEEDQKIFDRQIKYFYNNMTEPIEDLGDLTAAARESAEIVRLELQTAHKEFEELGKKLGYQPGFIPLMYSDEYLDYLGKVAPRQGPETRGRYRGNMRRTAFTAPPSADELVEFPFGEVTPTFLSPMQANKILNSVNYKSVGDIPVFETDPLKILERYTEWAARTVASERFAGALKEAGIAMYIPADINRVINLTNAAFYASATKKVSDEGAKAIQERLRIHKEELAKAVSDEEVVRREAERAGLLVNSQQQYDVSNQRLVDAVRRQRELDYELLTLDSNIERMYSSVSKDVAKEARLDDVSSNMMGILDDARAAVRNARRRLKRAKSNVSVTARIKELTEAQGRGEPVYVWDPAQNALVDAGAKPATREEVRAARRKVKENVLNVRELENQIDSELETVAEMRNGINSLVQVSVDIGRIATDDFRYTVTRYAEIMIEKYKLSEAVVADIKPARSAAKQNLDLLERDIALPRAEAIRTATMTFVDIRQRFLTLSLKGANKVDIKASRAAMNDAWKTLQDLLSDVNPTRAKQSTANRRYLITIKELAERVSSTEVEAVFALVDSHKMNQLMDALQDPSITHDIRMRVIGDIQTVYRRVRDSGVTDNMLRMLDKDERAIFEAGKVYEDLPSVYTAKRATVFSDLKAAESAVVPNEKLIQSLRKELDFIDSLTEENGLRLIGANKVKVPAAFEDLYAPLGVRQHMERLYQLENNISDWESFIGRIYDPLSLVWKTAATVGRGPAYTMTNLIGGLVNNWLGGVEIVSYAKASKLLTAFEKAARDAQKKDPTLSTFEARDIAIEYVRNSVGDMKIAGKPAVEVYIEYLDSGVWLNTDTMAQSVRLRQAGLTTSPSLLAEDVGIVYEAPELPYGQVRGKSETALHRSVNFALTWKVQRGFNELNQVTEQFLRLSAFISGYERFGARQAAVDNVMLLHFDYQDLSEAEQWLKRIVPFYTWTRNNIPLQFRAAFMQQDKIRKLIILNENIEKSFGADGDDSWISEVLPDYIDINGGFASRFTFGGNHIALFPKTPIQDVDKLFRVGYVFGVPVPVPRMKETAQMLGPAVTPLEYITNTNFDTGQQFRSTGEKIEQLSRSLLPYIGTGQRILSSLTVPATLAGADLSGVPLVQSEKAMSNLYNLLIGAPFGASTITEKTLLGGMINKSKVNAAQLKKLASEAGINLEWLRKEIKKGTTVTELQAKIARGEGSSKQMELDEYLKTIEGTTTDRPSREYAKLLAAFRGDQYGGF